MNFVSFRENSFSSQASPEKLDRKKAPYMCRQVSVRSEDEYTTSYDEKAARIYKTFLIEHGEVNYKVDYLIKNEKQVFGTFSTLFTVQGVSNVVMKVLNFTRLSKEVSPERPYNSEQEIKISVRQFILLKDLFSEEGELFSKEGRPPIIEIYNPDEAATCGYTIVEKGEPLTTSPWEGITSIDNLNEIQVRDLNSAVQLMRADNYLRGLVFQEEAEDFEKDEDYIPCSALDLKLNNFGRDEEGNLLLLDYVNQPFQDPGFEPTTIDRLAMGNLVIKKYLENVALKEELTKVFTSLI